MYVQQLCLEAYENRHSLQEADFVPLIHAAYSSSNSLPLLQSKHLNIILLYVSESVLF